MPEMLTNINVAVCQKCPCEVTGRLCRIFCFTSGC